MDSIEHPFIVGIDLGTTNCAVAFVDLRDSDNAGGPDIQIFNIPQLTNESEIRRMSALPSFLYMPGSYEISKTAIALPWGTQSDNFVGVFAREQGVKVPSRLVSSAKSWLCHEKVDRKARILPWGDAAEIPRVSPVAASAAYLDHIRKAWNDFYEEEDLFLEHQKVIVTVPASFDEVARDLTLESAAAAGLKDIILIEEPLAAFYSWLIAHEKDWQNHVSTDELILVCDVGGGTTDFTLIALKDMDGNPGFERIAVGDHLILGGDNVDIALARAIETQTSRSGARLSLDRWKRLCNQCRQAKEEILNRQVTSKRITMMGQGSQLIAGTISANLTRELVEEIVLENFFPLLKEKAIPETADTAAPVMSEFGLPYEADTAITRHLARFLSRHDGEVRSLLNRKDCVPDFILFNGGSLKPEVIRDRIVNAMGQHGALPEKKIKTLENTSFDLAVARGAAYYGLVKIGRGVRVGSGSPRGYYLGVAEKVADGTITQNAQKAICLVERGAAEGSRTDLEQHTFDVLANQPVLFELYSSSYRSGDRVGDLVAIDDSLTRMPKLQTVVAYGKKGEKTTIPVQITAGYTEVGTLDVQCRSMISPHRWRLQFDLRNAGPEIPVKNQTVLESADIEKVCHLVSKAFSRHAEKADLDGLMKQMAALAGKKKENWPLSLIRSVADRLLDDMKTRKIGPDHEARWLNLTGYCLRPGSGDGFDPHRVKKLWKIYGEGPIKDNSPQVRMEWWILWRRVAAGLSAGLQKQFAQDAGKLVMPKKGAPKKMSAQERLEIFMAVANMERLEVEQKIKWGRQLMADINPKKTKPQQLWSLSRLGSRELLYGSTDRVIPAGEAVEWIEYIMTAEWKNPAPAVAAAIQLARKTGDRLRDIDDAQLAPVRQWLTARQCDAETRLLLERPAPIARQEEKVMFGEALPVGLVMTKD